MGLIKSSDAPGLARAWIPGLHAAEPPARPLEALAPPSAPDPVHVALTDAVEQLTRALEAREARIAELQAEAVEAVARADAQGRAAGRAEADSGRAAALELLDVGLRGATELLARDLSSLEALAVALAREALGKMLSDPDRSAGLVANVLRRQVETLEAHAVLRVEVSAVDFTEQDALDALAEGAGLKGVDLVASPSLEAGGCRIRLRLGELDVGLPQQWGRLRELLDEMAGEGAA